MNQIEELINLLEDKSFKDMVFQDQKDAGWENWLEKNQDKKNVYLIAKKILKELNPNEDEWTQDRKAELLKRLQVEIKSRYQYSQTKNYFTKKNKYTFAPVFAILIIVFGLAFLVRDFSWYNKISSQLDRDIPTFQYISKVSPPGQKTRIILPDGSNVFLNSDSELTYSEDFAINNRNLYLNGEAFFEVAPDSVLPFRVNTGNLTTEALGTSFNIRSYGESNTKIQLASGMISVSNEDKLQEKLILVPGQEVFTDSSKEIWLRDFNINEAFKWKDGILAFSNATLEEVRGELERWYGVKIYITGFPKKNILVNAEFHKDYLSNVLNSLGFTFGFEYEIDQKEIKIKFK
ncbi:FecR family protein [Aquiflexum sp.]|uniref:FecR family protein n=1 Tax=Aquiflexum sp. TaxID=1872584 RepID=UPI003593ED95